MLGRLHKKCYLCEVIIDNPLKQVLVKPKQIIATATVLLAGWFAATHVNGTHSKYEQDVADYQALAAGDSLPTQARITNSRPQAFIHLENAVKRFRETEAPRIPEAVAAASGTDRAGLVDRLLSTAFRFIGVPYRSGQSGPGGFDCSGFTSYVYKQNNLQLTRSSRSQYTEGSPVASVTEMRKGDLVFFGGRGGRGGVGHVGIVTEVNREAGSFKFIHASTSSGIRVDNSSDPYFSQRYVGARRIVR